MQKPLKYSFVHKQKQKIRITTQKVTGKNLEKTKIIK